MVVSRWKSQAPLRSTGAIEGVAPAGARLSAARQTKIAPNGRGQQPGSSVCKAWLLGQNGRVVAVWAEMRPSIGSRARVEADPDPLRRYDIALGIATGQSKADAVARMIEGPLGADCPATALQMHRQATVVLDEEAASNLRLRDYYETVHPAGAEARLP